MMPFCPSCGTQNPDGYKFCLGCGVPNPEGGAPPPLAPAAGGSDEAAVPVGAPVRQVDERARSGR